MKQNVHFVPKKYSFVCNLRFPPYYVADSNKKAVQLECRFHIHINTVCDPRTTLSQLEARAPMKNGRTKKAILKKLAVIGERTNCYFWEEGEGVGAVGHVATTICTV